MFNPFGGIYLVALSNQKPNNAGDNQLRTVFSIYGSRASHNKVNLYRISRCERLPMTNGEAVFLKRTTLYFLFIHIPSDILVNKYFFDIIIHKVFKKSKTL